MGPATTLTERPGLVRMARDTFDDTGEIRDSASPELFTLRRARDEAAARAATWPSRILKSDKYTPYLQDVFVTQRGERFVLPLKASYKSMGLGIVHDTSRSGETAFVEPTAVVDLNNKLKVAEIEVRRECRRILDELAAAVAQRQTASVPTKKTLTEMDMLGAIASFGEACGASPLPLLPDQRLGPARVATPPVGFARAPRRVFRSRPMMSPWLMGRRWGPVTRKSGFLWSAGPTLGAKTVC